MFEKTKVRGIALDESARFREAGLGRLLNESGWEKEGLLLSERGVQKRGEVQQKQCVWKEEGIAEYLEWERREKKENEMPEEGSDTSALTGIIGNESSNLLCFFIIRIVIPC